MWTSVAAPVDVFVCVSICVSVALCVAGSCQANVQHRLINHAGHTHTLSQRQHVASFFVSLRVAAPPLSPLSAPAFAFFD